jgi:TetR/AcrR family transcriptional regulator, mexJK operon transcriptional repressor
VYSHYGDKESLFFLVIRDTYNNMRERIREIADRTLTDPADVPTALLECVREIVQSIMLTPERAVMARLAIAEMPHFPALVELWRQRGIVPVITAPLARLAAAGRLDIDDPDQAAEHLSALTFGQVNNRSLLATIPVADAEADRILTSGIRVFLCAYGPK